MREIKCCLRRRICLYFVNMIICVVLFLCSIKKTLFSLFYEYGDYQVTNLVTAVMNVSVKENINDFVLNNAVFQNGSSLEGVIDFNLEVINSVACNIVNRAQKILKNFEYGIVDPVMLEQIYLKDSLYEFSDGIIYKIPVSMAFDNFLISNLGIDIPVKYKFVGSIKGNIISSVEEYGINNALIKITINIIANAKMILPISTHNKIVNIEVPVIIKAINGKVPSYYLGTNIMGAVN